MSDKRKAIEWLNSEILKARIHLDQLQRLLEVAHSIETPDAADDQPATDADTNPTEKPIENAPCKGVGNLESWQPIGTAPKDETKILLFAPTSFVGDTCFDGHICPGSYSETWGEWRGEYDQCEGHVFEIDAPTHWMPLPAPPQ